MFGRYSNIPPASEQVEGEILHKKLEFALKLCCKVPFMVHDFCYTMVTTKRRRINAMYEFRNVRGHVEVYDNRGQFLFSADNEKEAREELEEA